MPARTEPEYARAPERRGIYLLSHPRSASNLFQKMLEKQPGYQSSGYKLFNVGFAVLSQLGRGRLSEWPEDERKALYDMFRNNFKDLEDEVADAQKNGKQAFIKEHAMLLSGPDIKFASYYNDHEVEPLRLEQRDNLKEPHTNPSSLPDRFLLSMQPIFQIRHPALMFPSMVRAQSRVMDNCTTANPRISCTLTLKYSRELYDWYLKHGGELTPRVIDADDIMNDPGAVRQLCMETRLDPDAIQYEWNERQEEDPLKASFLSTINGSKGIIKGLDASNLDFEKEKVKWKTEFGDELGESIAQFVSEAMPDYEYLMSRRTRGPQVVGGPSP